MTSCRRFDAHILSDSHRQTWIHPPNPCNECRARKTRCDGDLPCNICRVSRNPCSVRQNARGDAGEERRNAWTEPPHDRAGGSIPHGILEPSKQRFMGQQSSIAFPLIVGMGVQAPDPPRLHSFGYNAGVRPEPETMVSLQIAEALDWHLALRYINDYIRVLHPLFNFLDPEELRQRAEDHWHGMPQGPSFEAVISGVIALGLLFRSPSLERPKRETEPWMVQHAKSILEDSVVGRLPTVEQVAAYILRTLYVRSTSRPHLAWLNSCTMMHLVEATGLQYGPEDVILAPGTAPPDTGQRKLYRPKRTAHVAECLHVLIACDYGRSVMNATLYHRQEDFAATLESDLTSQLCALVQAMPVTSPSRGSGAGVEEQVSAIMNVASIKVEHGFLTMVKADLIFCLYRRLRMVNYHFRQEQIDIIISRGTEALAPVDEFTSRRTRQPFWNLVGTAFQFVCVLLALDTPDSLQTMPKAMEVLEEISRRLPSPLATEAYKTARQLARACLDQKRKGVGHLEQSLQSFHPHAEHPGSFDPDPEADQLEAIPLAPDDVAYNPYHDLEPIDFDLDSLLNINL
ncbi:putative C6 transcription factor [Aspergillus saccharolyticus JOP 1030-1]|uniref:Zn(2)-C6 fungal-type domain-containing protein n=1 Tax=Aspergillus saccharolyticus JOP 1030-1 TaxID=1450539 RepID=A0A318Z6X1_9EURO|nr:hypothetical protein BP01DRAFT_417499 [Aspergillus saccharolyticus JOP 1030-1]PYH43065.1 hypothetical protein BP01DRAFT_417499 [Aspergillus saccharolyticus JOP 1030-1]